MRVFVVLSLIVSLVGTSAFAYDPYPFERSDGKWGYVDDNHCWVIAPQFYYARKFSEGLAVVDTENGRRFIDSFGDIAEWPSKNFKYFISSLGDIHEGLARVDLLTDIGDKTTFIDKNGRILTNPVFDGAWDFSEGMAVVTMEKEGSFLPAKGYLASNGSLVIAPKYNLATRFVDGLAAMGNLGKVGFINKDGIYVIPPIFSYAEEFSEGLAAVMFNGKYGFINPAGRMVIRSMFDDVRSFSQGLAWVAINKKAGFINSGGIVVIDPIFDAAFSFSEGLSAVKIGTKWGYIDFEGNLAIPAVYDSAMPFEAGRASVSLNEKYFFISTEGNALLDPTCDQTR